MKNTTLAKWIALCSQPLTIITCQMRTIPTHFFPKKKNLNLYHFAHLDNSIIHWPRNSFSPVIKSSYLSLLLIVLKLSPSSHEFCFNKLSYSACVPIQNQSNPLSTSTAIVRYFLPTLADQYLPTFFVCKEG